MKKALVLTTIVAIVVALFGMNSCQAWHRIRFGMGARMRSDDADYEALDRDRRALAAGAEALDVEDESSGGGLEPYWTDFLGPGRCGVYEETPLLATWSDDGPPLLWRVPVGPGYSSVVVAEGLAFTLEQSQDDEVRVVAFDRLTGTEVWTHGWPERFFEEMSKVGPRSTPVWHDGSVFVLGAAGELRRIDARTGELEWRTNVLGEPGSENLVYGLSGSPLIAAGLVVVALGKAGPGGGMLAVDSATGEERWRAEAGTMSYTSPQLVQLLGRPMVVVASATRLIGFEPTSGDELWSAPWGVQNGLACTQPAIVSDRRVLMSSGYGKGAALFELTATDGGIDVVELWRSARLKTRYDSPVQIEGHLIGLDEGILSCLRVEDGRRLWKGGRYGQGQTILAGERMIVLSEDGELALLDVGPEGFEELVSFQALPDSMTLNPPALAHGLLYVRNQEELACFDLRVP